MALSIILRWALWMQLHCPWTTSWLYNCMSKEDQCMRSILSRTTQNISKLLLPCTLAFTACAPMSERVMCCVQKEHAYTQSVIPCKACTKKRTDCSSYICLRCTQNIYSSPKPGMLSVYPVWYTLSAKMYIELHMVLLFQLIVLVLAQVVLDQPDADR